MARDISIAFKASDNLSGSLRQMRRSVGDLTHSVEDYRKIQDKAFNQKSEVKLDISKAKKELKELSREVDKGAEGSREAFKEKQKELDMLQEEYKRLGKVVRDANKAEEELSKDRSRRDNANPSRNSSMGSNMGMNQGLNNLAASGIMNQLSSSLSNNLAYNVTSMFGAEEGSLRGNVAGGIATGASMGMIAGLPGAIAGAIVGGLSGVVNTATEKQQKSDDVFKNEVQNLYNDAKSKNDDKLKSGSDSASSREISKLSFTTLLGGPEKADKFLGDVQRFSSKTPFAMDDLLKTSRTLLSYGYKENEILPQMTKVGDAGSALGMSTEDINWVATSLGRMKSSNKASLEYLNPLIERGVPVMRYLSEHFGKEQGEIYEMLSKNLIKGAEATEIISSNLAKDYSGSMEKMSATFSGLKSTLEDVNSEIDKAMGEGYNEKRKEGMLKEISIYESELGEKMKGAYNLIGQYKADMENQYQQSIIGSMTAAMNSKDYIKAEKEGNGVEMGRIVAEAEAKAKIEYQNSEGYRLQLEADKTLVKNIQDGMVASGDYLEYGRSMADQFTIGWSGAIESARERGVFNPRVVDERVEKNGSIWQKFSKKGQDALDWLDEKTSKTSDFKPTSTTNNNTFTINGYSKSPEELARELNKSLNKNR